MALAREDPGQARDQLEEGIRLSVRTGDLANLAYFLETLGVVEALEGEPRRVALLHGAARQLRETVGSNVYGYYKPDEAMLAESVESARAVLGAEFDAAVAEGRALAVGRPGRPGPSCLTPSCRTPARRRKAAARDDKPTSPTLVA